MTNMDWPTAAVMISVFASLAIISVAFFRSLK